MPPSRTPIMRSSSVPGPLTDRTNSPARRSKSHLTSRSDLIDEEEGSDAECETDPDTEDESEGDDEFKKEKLLEDKKRVRFKEMEKGRQSLTSAILRSIQTNRFNRHCQRRTSDSRSKNKVRTNHRLVPLTPCSFFLFLGSKLTGSFPPFRASRRDVSFPRQDARSIFA